MTVDGRVEQNGERGDQMGGEGGDLDGGGGGGEGGNRVGGSPNLTMVTLRSADR